ncbi:MAG: hypothetical protein HZA22_00320 [Nitrospirae bacterium]|nr:hypothetical protein [Nitrospirota bacterium]MBI5694401.1 hypothetical protein [Nitrospirota bacterium]
MKELLTSPLLAALGFFLGYFYTRTMRLAEKLPEDYATKDDCRTYRVECHHGLEYDRTEMRQRMERIEAKLDRLIESMLRSEL